MAISGKKGTAWRSGARIATPQLSYAVGFAGRLVPAGYAARLARELGRAPAS